MIQIDFDNQKIIYTCTDRKGCRENRECSFDEFKKNHYAFVCEPCKEESHDIMKCTHCSIIEMINPYVFVQNLELHPYISKEEFINNPQHWYINPDKFEEMCEIGVTARHYQLSEAEWEINKQYHLLRRILEHNMQYEDVKDEPELYEKVHMNVPHNVFKKAWREHESGIKHIKEYLLS